LADNQPNNSVLLVGNGPIILTEGAAHGAEIDGFTGKIVRFNNYVISGYEVYVGTRTDWWCTAEDFGVHDGEAYERVICSAYYGTQGTNAYNALLGTYANAERIPAVYQNTSYPHPSSGAMLARMLIAEGKDVWLTGFDHFAGPRFHYWRTTAEEAAHFPLHSYNYEYPYFADLASRGLIRYFGHKVTVPTNPSIIVVRGSRAEPGGDGVGLPPH